MRLEYVGRSMGVHACTCISNIHTSGTTGTITLKFQASSETSLMSGTNTSGTAFVCVHAHVFTGHSYIIAAPPLSPSAAAYPAAAVAARSARLRSTDVMTFAGCNGHSLVHCLGRHIDFPLKRFHVLAKTRESGWQNG